MKINTGKLNKQNSRTTNTIFNFTSSIGGQLITLLMRFVIRTAFIHTLGKTYLGIGGLFNNILTMLSLVDMGVGSAILYKLYDPIARKDKRRIAILMNFYKSAYRVIGLAVGLVGICLIPFLPYLISDYDKLEGLGINAIIIFLLYLFKSVSTYLFFAYRSSIIKANQKEYLITLIEYFFTITAGIVQIVCLILVPNFVLYIAISIGQVIFQNIACAMLANRMYPYINEKQTEKLERGEIKGIIKDCGALFLYRMNGVVLKATDNIVLSTFLGLDVVALYSNYYIFYTTIRTLFMKIFNSVSHSLGNLHAKDRETHAYQVFEATMLVTAILGSTAMVGIFVVADDFVTAWIGHDWALAQPFSLLLGIELFTLAFRTFLSKYRSTMGLFQQAKFRPLAGMILNLVISIALVNVWGISGVLVGTIAADWLTYMWYDPLIINKYGFKNLHPITRYYLKYIKYFAVACVSGALDYYICSVFMTDMGWITVIVHALICFVTAPGLTLLVCWRNDETKYVIRLGKRYRDRIFGKFLKRSKS